MLSSTLIKAIREHHYSPVENRDYQERKEFQRKLEKFGRENGWDAFLSVVLNDCLKAHDAHTVERSKHPFSATHIFMHCRNLRYLDGQEKENQIFLNSHVPELIVFLVEHQALVGELDDSTEVFSGFSKDVARVSLGRISVRVMVHNKYKVVVSIKDGVMKGRSFASDNISAEAKINEWTMSMCVNFGG